MQSFKWCVKSYNINIPSKGACRSTPTLWIAPPELEMWRLQLQFYQWKNDTHPEWLQHGSQQCWNWKARCLGCTCYHYSLGLDPWAQVIQQMVEEFQLKTVAIRQNNHLAVLQAKSNVLVMWLKACWFWTPSCPGGNGNTHINTRHTNKLSHLSNCYLRVVKRKNRWFPPVADGLPLCHKPSPDDAISLYCECIL